DAFRPAGDHRSAPGEAPQFGQRAPAHIGDGHGDGYEAGVSVMSALGSRPRWAQMFSTRILRLRPSSMPSNMSLTCWLEVGKVPTEGGKSLPPTKVSSGTRWPILSTGASRTMPNSVCSRTYSDGSFFKE